MVMVNWAWCSNPFWCYWSIYRWYVSSVVIIPSQLCVLLGYSFIELPIPHVCIMPSSSVSPSELFFFSWSKTSLTVMSVYFWVLVVTVSTGEYLLLFILLFSLLYCFISSNIEDLGCFFFLDCVDNISKVFVMAVGTLFLAC